MRRNTLYGLTLGALLAGLAMNVEADQRALIQAATKQEPPAMNIAATGYEKTDRKSILLGKLIPDSLLDSMATPAAEQDPRHIEAGLPIPDESYCDQPYAVKSLDGSNHWLIVVTTGPGNEGDRGQHIVSMVSTNQGVSWSVPVDIEPTSGPEASWTVPYITPYGRVYAFYTFNKHRLEPGGSPITASRQDILGAYCFRYTDDFGATWSDRYEIPYRQTSVDLSNSCPGVAPGEVNMFWGVSKAIEREGEVLIPFSKIGTHLVEDSEGWLVASTDLMTETNAAALHWAMRPEGESGIRNPAFGSVQAEHVAVALSNGDLYDVFRTTTGYAAHSVSRDGGRTWTLPAKLTYADGSLLKNPRANCKVWRATNGKYLLWFHNNSTTSYNNRNPAWLCGGIERDGGVAWSQPEILLFDPTVSARISYPDLIEHDGRYWLTETQKTVARVHELDATLLEGVWAQATNHTIATNGLRIDLDLQAIPTNKAPMPVLDSLATDGGFALDFWVLFNDLDSDQIVADSRDAGGKGFVLRTVAGNKLELGLNDGSVSKTWDTDSGALAAGRWQHVAVIVDGSPDIITFVVNGKLLDGGGERDFGWTRFDSAMADVNGAAAVNIGPALDGELGQFRLYDRYLRTSEAVGNFRAWSPPATTWPTVADTFHYDGTYEPDDTSPPPGNDTWTVFITNPDLDIVPNSPSPGLATFDDHVDGSRMAINRTYADAGFNAAPANYQWSYTFKMQLVSKPLDNGYVMLFGVRSEGTGNGKAVLLAFDTEGRLGFANANGSGFLVSDLGGDGTDYTDETLHTFRVEKRDNGSEMEIRAYVDDHLITVLPYASFQDDVLAEGFGIWSSTPGTEHVVVDDVRLGTASQQGMVLMIR